MHIYVSRILNNNNNNDITSFILFLRQVAAMQIIMITLSVSSLHDFCAVVELPVSDRRRPCSYSNNELKNYEGQFNGTHYYLSCCFKCFAHLFPLNISSSLKYSFNFLFKFFTSLFAVAISMPPLLGFAIINNYSSTSRKRLHKTCTPVLFVFSH